MSSVRVAGRIVLPFAFILPVAAVGEELPILVKPTKSMRIDARPQEYAAPRNLKTFEPAQALTTLGKPPRSLADASGREPNSKIADAETDLRGLIAPAEETRSEINGVARTQINRFVDLSGEQPRRTRSVPSIEIPSRSPKQAGNIQMNGLVADAPPKLRRFTTTQRNAIARSRDQDVRDLVAKEVTMPARPLEDLDQALDALSSDQLTLTPPTTALPAIPNTPLRSTARRDGFGMLAIDQIGEHLELHRVNENSTTATASGADDLRQFLQAPTQRPTMTLAEPTAPADGDTAIDFKTRERSPSQMPLATVGLPQLPPPVRQDRMVSDRRLAADNTLPSPFEFDPNGEQPKEVDELVAGISDVTPAGKPHVKTNEKRGLFSVLFPRPAQDTQKADNKPQTPEKKRRNRGILGRLLK
ncbi:MAG: hypothetical protein AAFX06_29855 [Planctomycetota bacterium]